MDSEKLDVPGKPDVPGRLSSGLPIGAASAALLTSQTFNL
jgi:hypothetical protein